MSSAQTLLAEAAAKQLMLCDPAVREQRLASMAPAEEQATREALNRLLVQLGQPETLAHCTCRGTLVDFWKRHWRTIKLHAVAWRYYQHQNWEVRAGDLYCITRYGPALYRIDPRESMSICMLTLCNDDGVSPKLEPHDWDAEEFRSGGFHQNRLHIPTWIWKEVLRETDWELTDAATYGL